MLVTLYRVCPPFLHQLISYLCRGFRCGRWSSLSFSAHDLLTFGLSRSSFPYVILFLLTYDHLNQSRLGLAHHPTTDGSDFKGERLTVQFARGPRRKENFPGPPDRPAVPRPRRTMFRMQISGLPETSWQVSSPSPFLPGCPGYFLFPWTFTSFLHEPCHLFQSVIRSAE